MKALKKTLILIVAVSAIVFPIRLKAETEINNKNVRVINLSSDDGKSNLSVEISEALSEALDEVKSEVAEARKEDPSIISIRLSSDQPNDSRFERPYLGIYTSNITLPKARELNYTSYHHGILITGTGNNSPARLYRLLSNDILMSVNGIRVMDDDHLKKVLDSFYVGDIVRLEIFRDGKIQTMEVELGSRNRRYTRDGETLTVTEEVKKEKKKHSVGYGGGTWMPIWFSLDMEDINSLVSKMGFSELDDKGLLFTGGGGKGHIGNGYFIGGMGAGYSIQRKVNVIIPDENKAVIRRMSYTNGFGGVTLDKRYALSSKIIVSPGFMLGAGSHKISIAQTDGDYDWEQIDSQLSNKFNAYASFSKSYIVVQPRVEVMFRLLSWLGLRAEAGYMYGYSFYNGWKTELADDIFETKNSPKTSYEGLTISIGPWFGF